MYFYFFFSRTEGIALPCARQTVFATHSVRLRHCSAIFGQTYEIHIVCPKKFVVAELEVRSTATTRNFLDTGHNNKLTS